MITLRARGNFKNTERFFDRLKKNSFKKRLDEYGRKGVEALSAATPTRTGTTASSWNYEIEDNGDSVSINWTNSNINKGVNIAVILQYGHATRNGGYVKGRDYINPAIQPIFDEIADSAWAEVINT